MTSQLAPLSCLAVLAALAAAPRADVIHVDVNATGSVADGTSWNTAWRTLRRGLNQAQPGDEVWVAAGTYSPDLGPGVSVGDRDAVFFMQIDVAIYGGFDGTETSLADRAGLFEQTILTGDLLRDDLPTGFANTGDNSFHIVRSDTATSDTRLDGFLVIGGNADTTAAQPFGAGLLCSNGTPTFANCTFRFNEASEGGGAVAILGGEPRFEDCRFESNRIDGDFGGAMWSTANGTFDLERCTFENNDTQPMAPSGSSTGGAIRHQSLFPWSAKDSVFEGNSSISGGAIYADSSGTLEGCEFRSNAAIVDSGGAVFAVEPITITGCVFEDNTSDRWGGALWLPSGTIEGSTFARNVANWRGGAVHAFDLVLVDSSIRLSVVDCTFEENVSLEEGGAVFGSRVDAVGCTFSGNSGFWAGGIFTRGGSVISSRFVGNHALARGGAIHFWDEVEPMGVVGCEFSGNHCDGLGGALYVRGSYADIVSSTLSANTAGIGGAAFGRAGGSLRFDASILWENSDSGGSGELSQVAFDPTIVTQVSPDPIEVSADFSIVSGWTGTLPGSGTTSDDPLFVDADGADGVFGTPDDDLRLQRLSPAHDGGNDLLPNDAFDLDGDGDTAEPLPIDLAGTPRILDSDGDGAAQIDIGAREFATLVRDAENVSIASGGPVAFTLEAGLPNSAFVYWMLGSTSGTSPGVDFGGGVVLPLVLDSYFLTTLAKPLAPVFDGSFLGFLDPNGSALAQLNVPSGLDPSLVGVELHHAFVAAPSVGSATFASNAVTTILEP